MKDVDIVELETRFYELVDEIGAKSDSLPAKELAMLYRELADLLEIIGDHEETA